MMQILVSLLVHLSAIVVLACTLISINEMSATTNHIIRLAYVLIATSAFACIAGELTGAWLISAPCALAMMGLAIFLAFDRRARWRSKPHGGHGHSASS